GLGACGAGAMGAGGCRVGREVLDDGPGGPGGDEDVDVADRLDAAPVTPGHFDLADAGGGAHVLQERADELVGVRELEATSVLTVVPDRLAQLLGGPAAESGELLDLSPVDGALQVVDGADPELLGEAQRLGGPDALQADQLRGARGGSLLEAFQSTQAAGFHQLRDIAGHVLADGGELLEVLAAADHLGHRL